MVLGGVNKNLYSGPIHWHQGKSDAYWMMQIDGLKANGHLIHTDDKKDLGYGALRGIADSGTSLLVVPEEYLEPLLPHLQVNSDCSNMDKLSSLEIMMTTVDNHKVTYTLTPDEYVMKREGSCKTGIAKMNL